jgi:hypothetical protein
MIRGVIVLPPRREILRGRNRLESLPNRTAAKTIEFYAA